MFTVVLFNQVAASLLRLSRDQEPLTVREESSVVFFPQVRQLYPLDCGFLIFLCRNKILEQTIVSREFREFTKPEYLPRIYYFDQFLRVSKIRIA